MIKTALLGVSAVMLTSFATVAEGAMQPAELRPVLVVTKSDNKNELHYGATTNAACLPSNQAPLHPYWQMLERGPHVTEGLSRREAGMLGVARQNVDGAQIYFAVNAMPDRTFVAHVAKGGDGSCASTVDTTIAGVPARVTSVYAKLKLFGVDYVQLDGLTANGKPVQERVQP